MAVIRDKFVNEGFYDVTEATPPGHSYGRINLMLEDPSRIVGFEEQYAAAAGVMARAASLPAWSSATRSPPTGGRTGGPR